MTLGTEMHSGGEKPREDGELVAGQRPRGQYDKTYPVRGAGG